MNQTEKNAIDVCNRIRTRNSAMLSIQWVKSRTWGMNPNVYCYNLVVGKASGCGYDKESAALAEFLHFLPTDTSQQMDVHSKSGCGFNSLADALHKTGWLLEKTYSGKVEDAYTISRIGTV